MKSWSWWICLAIFMLPLRWADADEHDAWQALADGGHVALMRHAVAPGSGDPPGFSIDDCSTQRNLSDNGRRQAEAIGQAFRDHGIRTARVYSSQWCRCLETAALLGLGQVGVLPALNSFFEHAQQREPQTRAVLSWLDANRFKETLLFVTHQVNITALTGVYPRSGEVVVVRRNDDGLLSVVGRVGTP